MNYAQAAAFIRTALEMGRAGIIPAERAFHIAIGTTAQFELMLRQKDIIGEWAPAAELTSKNEAIATVYGAEIWTGYFRWERIPGWRWRMKTSKSKYRAAADFDLQTYSLLFPLLEQVPHHLRFGGDRQGRKRPANPGRQPSHMVPPDRARCRNPRRGLQHGQPRRRRDRGGRIRRLDRGDPGRPDPHEGRHYLALYPPELD